MLVENQVIEFTATPSFCNFWPDIAVDVNGTRAWQGTIDSTQRLRVPVEFQEQNQVKICYLNKRKGPVIWDTVTDGSGKIIQDQHCIISNINIGRSRCDFLIDNLIFYGVDGTEERSYGFMSQQGFLLIEFPGNVYDWILNKRQGQTIQNTSRSSALSYWSNYIIDHDDTNQALIKNIKKLLDDDKNSSN